MGIIRSVTRGFIKPCVDVKSWISWSSLKSNSEALSRMFKPAFDVRREKDEARSNTETFSEALERQGLKESDLPKKIRFLSYYFRLYVGLAVLCFLYGVYLVFRMHFFAAFVMVLILILFLAKAYEMSLWRFQMKERKLGCTFKEWWNGKIEAKESK